MLGTTAQTFREISCEDAGFLRMLRDASLPSEDLAGPNKRFWGTHDETGHLVAAGGLEVHGTSGIMRSCVVRDTARGRGLGAALVDFLAAQARAEGLEALFLLTETAEAWFAKRGFDPVDRADVPAPIAASSQFADICPASAAALRRPIARTS